MFFFDVDRTAFRDLDIFLGAVSLVYIQQQNSGVNRGMRFMQCFGRQLLQNLEPLGRPTLRIK